MSPRTSGICRSKTTRVTPLAYSCSQLLSSHSMLASSPAPRCFTEFVQALFQTPRREKMPCTPEEIWTKFVFGRPSGGYAKSTKTHQKPYPPPCHIFGPGGWWVCKNYKNTEKNIPTTQNNFLDFSVRLPEEILCLHCSEIVSAAKCAKPSAQTRCRLVARQLRACMPTCM